MSISKNIYKKRGVDLVHIGNRFGKWTVIKNCPKEPNKHTYYVCRCDCSNIQSVDYHHLINGESTGCRSCSGRISPHHCKKGHDLNVHGTSTRGKECALCRIENYIKRKYGITAQDYINMFKFQAGKCAICGKNLEIKECFGLKEKSENGHRAEVDHRHVTKKLKPQPEKRTLVRGLLCGGRYAGCNARLGRVDNVEWLRAAASYVENPPAQRIFAITKEHTKLNTEERGNDKA